MGSPSWKDTVFFLTYDEGGGLFDHVPPMATVNPDGIPPIDLKPGDIPETLHYRIPSTVDRVLAIRKEELRLAYSGGLHGDAEVH